MSVMTQKPTRRGRAAAATGAGPASRRVRRTAEYVILGLGLLAALVTMGGFTLVVNQLDQGAYSQIVAPALHGEDAGFTAEQAYEAGRTLAAWFGTSFVVMLLVSAVGIAHMRLRPHRRTPAWWFLATGLICLLGSQLVLFPIAFPFFVVAGLLALRPVPEGSLR